MCSLEKSHREGRLPQRRKTPSFSSSLLDAIYRSIDDESNGDEDFPVYRETTTMRKKQTFSTTPLKQGEGGEVMNLRRAVAIEKWTEKQRSSCTSTLLKSTSTSTSSDSSSAGAFSSSEAESNYRTSSTSSCFTPRRPKPVRTSVSSQPDRSEKPKQDGGFTKTKLRALKIYGDLKKAKQNPISPGRRIASFLNSLFNAKKEKICSVETMEDLRPERKSKSTCSSASSFSRSCLSKTPSSRGKLSNGVNRSVRFYPVSVIVGEDCRPCGQKCLYKDDPSIMPMPSVKKIAATPPINREVKKDAMDKNRRVKSAGQDLVNEFKFRDFRRRDDDDNDGDDDDDAESYASSDLFELEHLIGIGRYREELPVYETTSMKTNQAIANGFIL
ncbi:hypothetical protein L1049_022551 [Liquidambar formosana]|uniref:Protein BIG GRAIN 1-like A n=1 Tax=Liquidambar formosana TaxID=63359 RepID=A0AAP0WP61_LIQFO